MNAKAIERKIKSKIGHTKIQELKNHFFYAGEFLIWLANCINKRHPPLSGNFNDRWKFILKFDSYIEDGTLEVISITELLE